MADEWTVFDTDRQDGEPIELGPWGDAIPRSFSRELRAVGPEGLDLALDLHFDGDRVEAERVCVVGHGGRTVSPRDLAAVPLGAAISLAAQHAARGETWRVGRRPGRRSTDDELRLVAAVYAFAHATWGKPRQTVMDVWGLPRATATLWIRRARALFPAMPEATAGAPKNDVPDMTNVEGLIDDPDSTTAKEGHRGERGSAS